MKYVTDYVHPDEPCWGLYEGPSFSDSSRWVNVVWVVRGGGDYISQYCTDLGLTDSYVDIQPFAMPSEGENTVAQLQEHADKNRQDTYWAGRRKQMLSESTLIEDHLDQAAQIREVVANRSTFSPSGAHQRNGYSRRN